MAKSRIRTLIKSILIAMIVASYAFLVVEARKSARDDAERARQRAAAKPVSDTP